jgi:hypothetical protein
MTRLVTLRPADCHQSSAVASAVGLGGSEVSLYVRRVVERPGEVIGRPTRSPRDSDGVCKAWESSGKSMNFDARGQRSMGLMRNPGPEVCGASQPPHTSGKDPLPPPSTGESPRRNGGGLGLGGHHSSKLSKNRASGRSFACAQSSRPLQRAYNTQVVAGLFPPLQNRHFCAQITSSELA